MIAALYSSRPNGSKSFTLEETSFGWETIQKVDNVIGNLFCVVKSWGLKENHTMAAIKPMTFVMFFWSCLSFSRN